MKYVEERKFETKYNQNQWNIYWINDYQLCFEGNDDINDVPIRDIRPSFNFLSIEQVSRYEFLLLSEVVGRVKSFGKLGLGIFNTAYLEIFTHCHALSDDFLFFEHPLDSVLERPENIKYSVYSIKQNGKLKEFEWLSTGYDISVIDLSDDEKEKEIVLHVTKTLFSDKGNDYVQFLVDPNSFQPISKVHSTLRDSYISVQSKEEVEAIIQEDCMAKPIVDDYFSEVNDFSREKAMIKLLSK